MLKKVLVHPVPAAGLLLAVLHVPAAAEDAKLNQLDAVSVQLSLLQALGLLLGPGL
jgi:hypothetical protein